MIWAARIGVLLVGFVVGWTSSAYRTRRATEEDCEKRMALVRRYLARGEYER